MRSVYRSDTFRRPGHQCPMCRRRKLDRRGEEADSLQEEERDILRRSCDQQIVATAWIFISGCVEYLRYDFEIAYR